MFVSAFPLFVSPFPAALQKMNRFVKRFMENAETSAKKLHKLRINP